MRYITGGAEGKKYNITKNNPYNDERVCSICKNNSSSVNNNLDGININEVNEKLKNLKIPGFL